MRVIDWFLRFLISGEKVKKADIEALKSNNLNSFTKSVSEKGLRYDLTVPLARYVCTASKSFNLPF